ncbi:resuscitation-promoting factor [Alkalibacterium iburiense]|uniref:Resuscitation-promoting factor n=1 Tax=Alkalibacterium iburiense TaxID=290589 RepID=A0ABP3H092_9LACT
MYIQVKHLVKAGITLSAATLFLLGNDTDASAQEYSHSNWEARTVSEIREEINSQKEEQNADNGTIEYTFQWGDTLWGISEATDFSVDKLVQVNDIDNRSLIHVGTTIYLSEDTSIISVKNEEDIVSYDVSTDEVTETETPAEVVEAQEEEETQEAETTVETSEPEAETTPPAETAETETNQSNGYTLTVEATAYSRNQPSLSNFTFTGIDLRENSRVIAVDPNVIPLGSTIYVPGYGEYVAGDTGGAIKGNRIDLHMEDLQAAIQFGRRTLEIQVVE